MIFMKSGSLSQICPTPLNQTNETESVQKQEQTKNKLRLICFNISLILIKALIDRKNARGCLLSRCEIKF